MKSRIKKCVVTFAGLLIGAGLIGNVPELQAKHKHKHHHHHHDCGHWHGYHPKAHKVKHVYYYYPAQQVYYSPVKRGYYYLNQGAWVFNAAPPVALQLGNKVRIELGSPVPYVEHAYVVQQHPVVVLR